MKTPPRPRPLGQPQSSLDDMEPTERLVLRVTSLERWVRTLTTQHEQWLRETDRLTAQLEMTADRLAKFSDELWGLDPSPDFDLDPPY